MNSIKITSKSIHFETVKYILENATIKSEIPNDIFNCGYSFENNGFELEFTSIIDDKDH